MKTPGVKDVYMTDMSCVDYMVVISLEQHHYQGYVRQVMEQTWAYDVMAKWVIVVDDDIDIFDRGHVEWALATRVLPHRDIWITPPNQPGSDLDPAIPQPDRVDDQEVRISRIGIDATTKFKGFEFGPLARPHTVDAVLERWDELGLPSLD
jgi:UbiD family decarboxylase